MAFQKAIKESDVPEGQVRKATLGKREVAVIRKGGKFYCLDGVCTHEGGPLGEGSLNDGQLVCPWHEGRFDIATGEADPETDWVTDVKSFKTKVEGGYVHVDL